MKHRLPSSSRRKTGALGRSKVTNQTPYSPHDSQVDAIVRRHHQRMEKAQGVYYYAYPPSEGYIQPLSLGEVRCFIEHVPQEFLAGLKGVFLCPGSKKQMRMSGACYAMYSYIHRSIFIFPFHESLAFDYPTKPKPSISQEYERHGARWKRDGSGWSLEFTREALRSFYLKNVLPHEVGHHVEDLCFPERNGGKSERFADWFAYEFGMRKGSPTEFGAALQQIIAGQSED